MMDYRSEACASIETDNTISIISHNNEGDHANDAVEDGNDPVHATIEVKDGNDPVVISILERGDHATIEVRDGNDPVVISIQEKFDSLFPLSSECCIYTVPENIRKINAEAYTPNAVSIGPHNRGIERLQAMEEHKLRYARSFVSRNGRCLEDYVKFIREKEQQVRRCYAENIKLGRDEFVDMILVDCCFLVELVLRKVYRSMRNNVDVIFNNLWMFNQIMRDILLLENQIPFFVLEDLFHQWLVFSGRRDISFKQLCHRVFFKLLTKMDELPDRFFGCQVFHFVHFLLLYYLPAPEEYGNYGVIEAPPTVTELHEAGVRFKKGTSNRLLDIKFNKGILEISHLDVYDRTETILRNLIAFEQCHHLDGTIMDYMQLMDGLINTPKDVDLLIKNKIIRSHIGSSEDVSKMFNNIIKGVCMSQKPYFSNLCNNLNDYRKSPQHRWKAILRRDYFNTPWKIVSINAAIILLALTFIQAVCSILSVQQSK